MSDIAATCGTVKVITVTASDKVVSLRGPTQVITVTDKGRQGAQGAGLSPFVKVQFTYTDGPSLIVLPVANGDTIVDSEIVIETAFDDVAATLSLGSVANSSLILSTSENLPATVGNYGNQGNFKFAITEQIRLYINPGSSTQGAGHVLLSKI